MSHTVGKAIFGGVKVLLRKVRCQGRARGSTLKKLRRPSARGVKSKVASSETSPFSRTMLCDTLRLNNTSRTDFFCRRWPEREAVRQDSGQAQGAAICEATCEESARKYPSPHLIEIEKTDILCKEVILHRAACVAFEQSGNCEGSSAIALSL